MVWAVLCAGVLTPETRSDLGGSSLGYRDRSLLGSLGGRAGHPVGGILRGKDGKLRRSFGFASAFARVGD
jgi:hypothetical protein